MNAEDSVINKYPKAYLHRVGVLKYEIRRPREEDDPEALVTYVNLSAMWDSPEAAWEHAERICKVLK